MLKHLLITRPIGKGNELVANLEAAGFKVSHTPVLRLDYLTPTSAELAVLDEADVIIFISQDAVKGLAALTTTLPANSLFISVGTSTASALQSHFKCKSIVPEQQDTEGMLALPVLQQVADKRVVIVKGRGGRPDLAKTLKTRQALLNLLEVYERLPAAQSADRWLDHWKRSEIDGIVITSNAAADAIFNSTHTASLAWLNKRTFFVVSERIAEYLKNELAVTSRVCVTHGAQDEQVFKAILAARQSLTKQVQVVEAGSAKELATAEPQVAPPETAQQAAAFEDGAEPATQAHQAAPADTAAKKTIALEPQATTQLPAHTSDESPSSSMDSKDAAQNEFDTAVSKTDLEPVETGSETMNNQEATMSELPQESTPVNPKVNTPISKIGVTALLLSLLGLGASAGIVWQGQQTLIALQGDMRMTGNENSALLQRLDEQALALRDAKEALNIMASKLSAAEQAQAEQLFAALEQMKASTAKPELTFAKGEAAYLSQLLTFKANVEQDWQTSLLLLSRIEQLAVHFPEPHLIAGAVAQDIATLRGQQNPPIETLYVSLLGLQQQASTLPLRMRILPDEKPVASAELSESVDDWLSNLKRSWDQFAEDFIKIRQRETITAAPLLSESEQQLLRAMLNGYLVQAQTGLLKQQAGVYQHALAAAQQHLQSHYDNEEGAVKGLLLELARLAEVDINKPKSVTLVTPELIAGVAL